MGCSWWESSWTLFGLYQGSSQDLLQSRASSLSCLIAASVLCTDEKLLHPTPVVTLLFVIITAVCQIICLNKALVCADTVVVVPLFYAGTSPPQRVSARR
jgi:hypothetical protein